MNKAEFIVLYLLSFTREREFTFYIAYERLLLSVQVVGHLNCSLLIPLYTYQYYNILLLWWLKFSIYLLKNFAYLKMIRAFNFYFWIATQYYTQQGKKIFILFLFLKRSPGPLLQLFSYVRTLHMNCIQSRYFSSGVTSSLRHFRSVILSLEKQQQQSMYMHSSLLKMR